MDTERATDTMRLGHWTRYVTLLGLPFHRTWNITEEVLCEDLDDDGVGDVIFIGNNGQRDGVYFLNK